MRVATTLLRTTGFILALVLVTQTIHAGARPERTLSADPANVSEALELYSRAHRAFVADEFVTAVELYQAVDRYVDAHPDHAGFFDHRYRGFSMVEMVRRYQVLGEFEPAYVHRVLAVSVQRVDAPYGEDRIVSTMEPEIDARARLAQQVCTRMLEVLSGGTLSVRFDNVSIDATMTQIVTGDRYDGAAPADRMVSSIRPYPSELLFDHLADYDTFLFCWNHLNTDGRRLYTGPHGWGGVARLPLVVGQLNAPPRG